MLLISDVNILIDMEVGGLIAPLFSLDYQLAIPDVLFYEELQEKHSYLRGIGLAVKEFDASMVKQKKLVYRWPVVLIRGCLIIIGAYHGML